MMRRFTQEDSRAIAGAFPALVDTPEWPMLEFSEGATAIFLPK
jgi:hypothetical protein